MNIAWTKADADLQTAIEAERRLVAEFNHRVKNLLSVVSAIAYLSVRNSRTIEEFEPAFTGRLEALSKGHELLARAGVEPVLLQELAEHVLSCAADGRAVALSGEPIGLTSKRVLGMGLILHELHTNALRHGALADPLGKVALNWRRSAGEVVIAWRETGAAIEGKPRHRGFGHQMIGLTARADLCGSVAFDWRPDGLVASIRFPLES